jgi:hypothetical protein
MDEQKKTAADGETVVVGKGRERPVTAAAAAIPTSTAVTAATAATALAALALPASLAPFSSAAANSLASPCIVTSNSIRSFFTKNGQDMTRLSLAAHHALPYLLLATPLPRASMQLRTAQSSLSCGLSQRLGHTYASADHLDALLALLPARPASPQPQARASTPPPGEAQPRSTMAPRVVLVGDLAASTSLDAAEDLSQSAPASPPAETEEEEDGPKSGAPIAAGALQDRLHAELALSSSGSSLGMTTGASPQLPLRAPAATAAANVVIKGKFVVTKTSSAGELAPCSPVMARRRIRTNSSKHRPRVKWGDECGQYLVRHVLFSRWDEPYRCAPGAAPPPPTLGLDMDSAVLGLSSHAQTTFALETPLATRHALTAFVAERKVQLENITVRLPTVFLTVRVANLAPDKCVTVRYSTDGWQSSTDVQANYLPGVCDGGQERFVLGLQLPNYRLMDRVEFCVRYNVAGQEFWDSHDGKNYVLVQKRANASASANQRSPTSQRRWPSANASNNMFL